MLGYGFSSCLFMADLKSVKSRQTVKRPVCRTISSCLATTLSILCVLFVVAPPQTPFGGVTDPAAQ